MIPEDHLDVSFNRTFVEDNLNVSTNFFECFQRFIWMFSDVFLCGILEVLVDVSGSY